MRRTHPTNLSRDDAIEMLRSDAVKLDKLDLVRKICAGNKYNEFGHNRFGLTSQEVQCALRAIRATEESKPTTSKTPNSGASVSGRDRIYDSRVCSTSSLPVAPICRQFWKAGDYDDSIVSKPTSQNGTGYLRIHPKFLHSNATSHKWVFGAVAELLDNSIDEIQNGATFVIVDKTSNPRDGAPALLIKDDGGGMDPQAMRRCISFGFSDKKSQNSIGKYGNGFKTSSMRLGADAVVFSRCRRDGRFTQSVGLLSYTFLMRTRQDKIVVPMVDYQFDTCSGTWKALDNEQHLKNNLSILMQWSPFSTEAELLKQCDDIGPHGTKIIVYNLWYGCEGKTELDFDSDPEDICICGLAKITSRMEASDQHLANRLQYSLRAYMSILYLRAPINFNIVLRGRVVELYSIANDLKYPEFKMYRPHHERVEILTTIGFVKEAPAVNVHGFNVYHKNRLILPFWHVVSYNKSRGRGVVGVLEADFINPTHNKQDFERTPLFHKLEARLKAMTLEYWNHHCGLVGYYQYRVKTTENVMGEKSSFAAGSSKHKVDGSSDQVSKKIYETSLVPTHQNTEKATFKRKGKEHADVAELESVKRRVVVESKTSSDQEAAAKLIQANHQGKEQADVAKLESVKRRVVVESKMSSDQEAAAKLIQGNHKGKEHADVTELESVKRRAVVESKTSNDQEAAAKLIQANHKCRAMFLELQRKDTELDLKITHLREQLKEAQREYTHLRVVSKLWDRTEKGTLDLKDL